MHHKKVHRSFHPHVTIVNRNHSQTDFVKAWARFSKEDYHAFSASAISLLKLVESKWEVIVSVSI